jgi:hypothetical protein
VFHGLTLLQDIIRQKREKKLTCLTPPFGQLPDTLWLAAAGPLIREICYNGEYAMVRVSFYFKEGCRLCDTAEEMLNGLREKCGLEVRKIDITSDETLYELYRFDIPVFAFRDGTTLHGRIRKKDLLKKLNENSE